MPLDIDDDEYVAKLLAQDAKNTTKTYDLVGLDAFNPKRSRAGAPKPNTNFLRHIIRQTDSHNAALLAKEVEEASSRLRQMNRSRDKERTEAVDRAKKKIEGRLSPLPKEADSHKRRPRDDHENEENNRRKNRTILHREHRSHSRSRRHRDRSNDNKRHKRRHESSDDDQSPHRSRRSRNHREDILRHRHGSGAEGRKSKGRPTHDTSRTKRRSYSESPARSRSRSPHRNTPRKRERSRSPKRSSHSLKISQRNARRSTTPASDSDPLEAIVGPLPPPAEPIVRSRGRGALKANSAGIESRFSAAYEPSMDMTPGSDVEDEWGEALEVMRDRERWKHQGADRLRAAGFKDAQVKKWEKGGDPMEDNVVWSKKGQDREWDRGKVVDEDGDVGLKAEWGRLK